MSDWPRYVSHKEVRAMPITGVTHTGTILVGSRHTVFQPTEPAMAARAEVGGYAVIYSDGFRSISPKKAFEDGYTRMVGDAPD
jgi:hypothetical protein